MNQQVMIVTLTPAALAHIKGKIEEQCAKAFRLSVKKTGCSGYAYMPDIVNEGKADDIEIVLDGIHTFIDKNSEKYLRGTVIDFIDQGLGQTKLLFNNPNAANLCGCGESFNLAEE